MRRGVHRSVKHLTGIVLCLLLSLCCNPVDNILSIINLDRSHASEPCPSYDFNECRNQVRFTSSKKIASLFASLEELLLEKYLGARNVYTD